MDGPICVTCFISLCSNGRVYSLFQRLNRANRIRISGLYSTSSVFALPETPSCQPYSNLRFVLNLECIRCQLHSNSMSPTLRQMHALRTQDGIPIVCHTAIVGGEKWCLLDSGAGFSQPLLAHLEGAYKSASCSIMPSRWDAQRPWHPFIPTSSRKPVRPWFLLDPVELQAPHPLQSQYQTDLRSLEVCASHICLKYPEYRGRRPEEFYATSFASLDQIQASQEAMLDRIGFLSWCTAWYDSLTFELRQLPNQADVVLKELRCAFDSRAGVIVDLVKDWKTVNFPLWAYYDVPILFKWTPAEQGDLRFSHVSPDQFPSTGTTQQRDAMYDWFFQDRSRPLGVTSGNGIRRDGNCIVDFEGWKRRPLSKTVAKEYFELGVIPFTVTQTGRHDQALFFRWRTKVYSEDPYLDDSDSDDPGFVDRRGDAESEEEAIRELYRPHHASQSDIVYDIDTGLPLSTPLPPTPSQTQRMVPTPNPSHAPSPSHNAASYRSQTSNPIRRSEWPLPRPVHVDSPWPRPRTPPAGGWALPGAGGRWSQPNVGHRADEQQWTPPQQFPAATSSNSGRGIRTTHNTGGWLQPNFGRCVDDEPWSLPQWPPVDASFGPERGVRTRRNTRRESHGRGALYQRDRLSRDSTYEEGRSSRDSKYKENRSSYDSRYEEDRRLSVHNTPSSSLSSAAENTSRAQFAVYSAAETTAPQRSNPLASSPSSPALQPVASMGPVGSGVHDAAVSQQPIKRMSLAEYKARKRCQEERAAPTASGSPGGMMAPPPDPDSAVKPVLPPPMPDATPPPSVDAEMGPPLDGPSPRKRCQEERAAPTASGGPGGMMAPPSDPDSAVEPVLPPPMSDATPPSSLNAEMGPPLGGPLPVPECPAATAPKVRFL